MVGNQFVNPSDLDTRKAAARMQSYRFQPKLRNVFVTFDMNMNWLFTITGVKEKSIRTLSDYGRHRIPLSLIPAVYLAATPQIEVCL